MRLYQPKYREKSKDGKRKGRKKQCKTFWLEFRGPDEIVHRWGLGTDNQDVAEIVKAQISSLNEWAKKGLNPPDDLIAWVRQQSPKLRGRIYKAGLLQTEQTNSTKPIQEHLKDYIEYMSLNSKSDYPQQVKSNIKRIIDACDFKFWADVDGHKVNQFVGSLIKAEKIGRNTGNHYVTSFKSFANWLKEQGKIRETPVIQSVDYEQAEQRAFEYKEWSRLLEATRKAPTRYGLTGFQRYILYKLAFDSGLRRNELRSLTRTSFDFKSSTVFVPGKDTKNGKEALQKITPETAALIKELVRDKMPSIKTFNIPNCSQFMIRKDCEQAGIETENYKGKIQFHSIRHTLATMLADKGVQPRTLQKILRHASITTSYRYYTHIMLGSEAAAIDKLRGLEQGDVKEQSA
ncbi:MAG: site-specific integrase [Planctomycetes bacterium]|nr:site-specific integrase [Planctomycetota bacterium]